MNKIYKSILSAGAASIVLGASLVPTAVFAWGDSANGRPSYTIADINDGKLGDTITFNSISDSKIGNEKNFVGARLASATGATWSADTIDVKDGETYLVRLYVHNNNPKGTERIAEGVKATFSVPTAVSKELTIVGYLDSSNATPNRYWDEITFRSKDNIYLEYVDGSAEYTNAEMGTVKLPNELITSGAKLGFNKLDGKIPGCYAYDGVVTMKIKVHTSVAAKLSKTVRIKGTKGWNESVDAKIGDEVEYQIEYVNLLSEKVNDVMIRDILPTNVEYVKDSTYLYNSNYQSGVLLKENTLTTTGINIGSYNTNGNAYIRFTGKVVDKSLACGSNQLVNWANVTVSSSSSKNLVYKDDASVMVSKDGKVCEEKPTPTPTPTPKPEPTPEKIVETGMNETVAISAVGAGSAVTLLGYVISKRK